MGSGLTGFALSVYIYQETGSATQLGVAMLATILPSLLISPLAGALVDRWDRRWVMVASDAGAALSTLAIWVLLFTGHLQVWHIYLANALSSVLGSFQQPAYMASITLLVPKQHLGRASQALGALEGVEEGWKSAAQERLASVADLLRGTTDRFFLKTRVCLPFARKCDEAAQVLGALLCESGDREKVPAALDALEKAARTLDERSLMQGMAIT